MTFKLLSEAVVCITKTAYNYMPPMGGSGNDPKDTKALKPDFSKIIESITALGDLVLFCMEPINTKFVIYENRICYDPEYRIPYAQGFFRWLKVAGRRDFEKHQILDIAVTFPQGWYEPGSIEAKTILRIQKVALHGLKKLISTYKDSYFPRYIQDYIKQIEKFELKNGEHSSDTSYELSEEHLSSDINVDERFDTYSDTESEPEKVDQRIFDIMKELWSQADLIGYAEKLETAYSDFQNNSTNLEDSKEEIETINKQQVKKFQKRRDNLLQNWARVPTRPN